MLRVLVKIATFVNGAVHKAGEEIVIAKHHFSEEIHELLEDLDPEPTPDPELTLDTSPPLTAGPGPGTLAESVDGEPLPASPAIPGASPAPEPVAYDDTGAVPAKAKAAVQTPAKVKS